MAGVPTELLCSIVLAGGDQIDKGLEGLDYLAKSAGNSSRIPIWMRNCLGEWLCLEPLERMIARIISKASTNQINNQLTNQTNQPIKPIIDQSRPTEQVIENDGSARPTTLAKAETN